jgi:DNA-binding SARP family transcriptional activator
MVSRIQSLQHDARLEISLLGRWQARVGDGALQLPTKKSQALLAYLALRVGQAHEREKLRALLWPESPRMQAQASLRQALLGLRKALPSSMYRSLRVDSSTVALDAELTWVDVAMVEQCVSESSRDALERAAALYRGELLEGFAVGEAAFDEWLDGERARLNNLVVGALERLAELQVADGSVERAIQTGLQAQRLEPMQERTHRLVMRLYALHGRRAEALAHYEQCVAMLERELGVEPDEQTMRLYRELLHAPAPVAITQPRSRFPGPLSPTVGREAELEQLEQAITATTSHDGRLIVLRGDAGVGKTRLCEALAARAIARGERCVLGRCFESERVLPFALWVDLLRSDASLLDDAAWNALPFAYRTELARLLPQRGAEAAEPPPAAADARALFEAFAELLGRIAGPNPLLVVVEDLHWADAMSLRLLSFVVRRTCPTSRIAVIGTVRAEELASAPDLRNVLHELDHQQHVSELVVAPLSRADTMALVRALATDASELTQAKMSEQIWAISEGNPLVIVETVRGLQRGAIAPHLQQLPVPERVRELISDHLGRLPPSARDALATAAVIGRRFDFDLLLGACDADAHTLAITIEELVHRRLLQGSGSGFYFTHDRIREVLYAGLLPPRRSILHGAVARALEALCSDRIDEVAGTIGYHYARAANAEASVAFLLRFAERSARNYGLEEALAALDEALRQSAALPASCRDSRQLELAIRRCDCLVHLGRVVEVEATLAPFKVTVERLGIPALAAPFHAWLTVAHTFLGNGPEAVEHGTRALMEAERCGDIRTAGLAHSLLSLEASRSGQFQRGIEHGRHAVAMLDPATTDYEFAAFAHMHLGANYLCAGDCGRALEAFAHANRISERAGSARAESIALAMTGAARLCIGELDASLAAYQRAGKLAPDPHSVWLSHLLLVRGFAFAAVLRGDIRLVRDGPCAASMAALEASLLAAGGPGMRSFTGLAMVALAEAYLAQQEAERARSTLQNAFEFLRAVGDPMGIGWALRVQGQAELALGNADAAAASIEEARRLFDTIGAPLEVAFTRLAAAGVAGVRGDWTAVSRDVDAAHQSFLALELPRWAALVAQASPSPAT